jgi:putative sterol carrier protein
VRNTRLTSRTFVGGSDVFQAFSDYGTVDIRDQQIVVAAGLNGKADLAVRADREAWLGFVSKDRHLAWELLRGRIRLKGSSRLLLAFGKCFPS